MTLAACHSTGMGCISWKRPGKQEKLRGQSWIEDENSVGRKEGEPGAQKLCSSPSQWGGCFCFTTTVMGPQQGWHPLPSPGGDGPPPSPDSEAQSRLTRTMKELNCRLAAWSGCLGSPCPLSDIRNL